MLPKSLEVILKLFSSSWSCHRWSNGGIPWLTLEQWRLTLELEGHPGAMEDHPKALEAQF
jgi:hypothetical protein